MTAFKDAFRKAGRSDLVDKKETAERKQIDHELEQVRLNLSILCKDRNDAMTAWNIARQHQKHFEKTTKLESIEYLAGIMNPLNQDIWRTGIAAKMQLDKLNLEITQLELKREELRKEHK